MRADLIERLRANAVRAMYHFADTAQREKFTHARSPQYEAADQGALDAISALADALASLSSSQESEPVASSIYGPYTPISVGCSTVASPVEPVAAKAEEWWIEATGANPFQGQPVWEIRHRDGSVKTTREPWNHAWQHLDQPDDIVAYRQRPTLKGEEPRCPKCGAQVDESFDCCKG